MTSSRLERGIDALGLALLKLGLGAFILHAGFSHVSDDDYARTVIAQQFAHAPRLDPSGTSWLPLPFWVTGGAMAVFGTSIAVARGTALVLGGAAVAAAYLALREGGARRGVALAAAALAAATPWDLWLGAAPVPEGWAGALVGAGLVAMTSVRARAWAGAALFAGALSRYEAWPACAAFAALAARDVVKGPPWMRSRCAAGALLALAGPLAWMGWNAHAHDGPLHFVTRVTRFRQAIGAADVSLSEKILGYPRALVLESPVVAALGVVALVGLLRSPALRRRWTWPVGAVGFVLGFLVWGDVRDGAPTHHAARALVAVTWVVVAAGVDALAAAGDALVARAWPARPRALVALAVSAAAIVGTVRGWTPFPGNGDGERRETQLARGEDLRRRRVVAADVTPCAFEHFALLAAWQEPERARVLPRTGAAVTEACPAVLEH